MPADIQSVSELTEVIKRLLEDTFFDVKVEGEISNLRPASSGHYYFTLKDEGAQLPAVMWRGVAQRYQSLLDDGLNVQAFGEIQVYKPHGRYQFIIKHVQPAGSGSLQEAFEKLKAQLLSEGLFEEAHKKQVPRISRTIGVVTAATGAAFQDIRQTIESRFPLSTILLYPSAVQGNAAAAQIVSGIAYLDAQEEVDVIIIGRGGGSLEDLWPFNEEVVARAIFACHTPIVSAVGHEIDFTISDFVADLRATTPTQAAVLLTPDQNELRMWLDDRLSYIQKPIERKVKRLQERMHFFESKLNPMHIVRLLDHRKDLLGMQQKWLDNGVQQRIEKATNRLKEIESKIHAKNPNGPLDLGYVRIFQEGKWVRKKADLKQKKQLQLNWKDGSQVIDPR